jgi:Uma2 family endonuclease
MILQLNLPNHAEAIAFNRKRWAEVHADAELVASPNRIETNAWGQIIMTPPPGEPHSNKQSEILYQLRTLLGEKALVDCPISTADGVRAADVAWYSPARHASVRGQLVCELAPEIFVEVLSPSNTAAEMDAKRQLYFEAGAIECWICDLEGRMTYYDHQDPNTPRPHSNICPNFPNTIND